jgi:hypothetical protein
VSKYLGLSAYVNIMVISRYTVSGGTFTATVPARSAIALFTGAVGTGSSGGGSSSATVAFRVSAETTFGDVSFSLLLRFIAY